jgi:hypothetical protein
MRTSRKKKKNGNGRRSTKHQENTSILSFSAICQASALFSALVKGCDAHNEN